MLKYLRSLSSLTSLRLSYIVFLDDEVEHGFADGEIEHLCSLKNLTDLDLSRSKITDVGVAKICSSLQKLKKLSLQNCYNLTDESARHLKGLPHLENLYLNDVENISFHPIFSLFQATKSTLKDFQGSRLCSCLLSCLLSRAKKILFQFFNNN